jgi:hypothetical protein
MQPNPTTFPFPEAVWSWSEGRLQKVISTGDQAPEIEAGIQFQQLTSFGNELAVNNLGQMVFSAVVARPGENAVRSLWDYDPASGVHYLARIGDVFQVSPGDSRTISAFSFASNALNDAGTLALKISFSDGSSGIFVTSVPEPVAMSFLPLMLVMLGRRRTKCRWDGRS